MTKLSKKTWKVVVEVRTAIFFGASQRGLPADSRPVQVIAELPIPMIPLGEHFADKLGLRGGERACAAAHEAIVYACNAIGQAEQWEETRREPFLWAAMGCRMLRGRMRASTAANLTKPIAPFATTYALYASDTMTGKH